MKKNKKGFTLIELIVVLAILAIVAAIAVPTAFNSIDKARVAADKATMESMNSAVRVYAAVGMADKDFATKGNIAGTGKPTIQDAFVDSGMGATLAIVQKSFQSTGGAARVTWVAGPKKGDLGHFAWDDATGIALADGIALITP